MSKADTYWFVSPVEREAFRQLEAENKRLREALRKYGRHQPLCTKQINIPETEGDRCTCGFDAALGDTEHE